MLGNASLASLGDGARNNGRDDMTGAMEDRPVWEREGKDWPNREASRFLDAAGLRWHVQTLGTGPAILLLHGTGAATHSWRALAPLLALRFRVIAPDLPGHGFTESPPANRLSLDGMAEAVAGLLDHLGESPALVAGHSAGAAILARMCLDRRIEPRGLISLNGALLPLQGWPGHVFTPAAKVLASIPLVPRLFARRAGTSSAVERLIRGTGSAVEPAAIELYRRLVNSPGHVAATLAMMAHWQLEALEQQLPQLEARLFLVSADNDLTVPPSEAMRVRLRIPTAEVIRLPQLGHLAHEERPDQLAQLIGDIACSLGISSEIAEPLEAAR